MKRFAKPESNRHRSESWQVIYMDLMTLIMVFFVILWTINQNKGDGISDTIGDHSTRTVSLPGDVLFPSGKSQLSASGREVLAKLFKQSTGEVLNFDSGNLVNRKLVIHGHTDADGKKTDNLNLGFKRAFAAYEEISKYGDQLGDHVIICTHADNSPKNQAPKITGNMGDEQKHLTQAKSKNRRITIEDRVTSRAMEEE